MSNQSHSYNLPVSTDSLATLTQATAGVDYLNDQCKISHEQVEQHQTFVKEIMQSADSRDIDLLSIAFGLEAATTITLSSTTINDQIQLMKKIEMCTVSIHNPFKDLRDVLTKHTNQPE